MTVKRCSTSVIIRELQTKTTMKYHVTSYRVAILKKKKKKISLCEDVEKKDHLCTVGGDVSQCKH